MRMEWLDGKMRRKSPKYYYYQELTIETLLNKIERKKDIRKLFCAMQWKDMLPKVNPNILPLRLIQNFSTYCVLFNHKYKVLCY